MNGCAKKILLQNCCVLEWLKSKDGIFFHLTFQNTKTLYIWFNVFSQINIVSKINKSKDRFRSLFLGLYFYIGFFRNGPSKLKGYQIYNFFRLFCSSKKDISYFCYVFPKLAYNCENMCVYVFISFIFNVLTPKIRGFKEHSRSSPRLSISLAENKYSVFRPLLVFLLPP